MPFPVPDSGAADVVAAHAVPVLAVLVVGTPHSVPLIIVPMSVLIGIGGMVIEVGVRCVIIEETVYVVVRFVPIALSALVLALVSVLVPCAGPSVAAMMVVRCVLTPVLAVVGPGIKLVAVSVSFSAGGAVAFPGGIR